MDGMGHLEWFTHKHERRILTMNRKLASLLIALTLMVPSLAGAVTAEDFEVKTTRNLLNLCTAPAESPYYASAVHFCHGYLVGAFAYYKADGQQLVCFTKPEPTRNEAIKMFIEWAKAHPQYMDEKPVETEFRFLMEKWPCKK